MASECKNQCNETCLCVARDLKCTDMCLCHGCGACDEILYEAEGETEFDSDNEDDGEEWTVVQNDVLMHLYIYIYVQMMWKCVLLSLLVANGSWKRKRLAKCKNTL